MGIAEGSRSKGHAANARLFICKLLLSYKKLTGAKTCYIKKDKIVVKQW